MSQSQVLRGIASCVAPLYVRSIIQLQAASRKPQKLQQLAACSQKLTAILKYKSATQVKLHTWPSARLKK